MKHYKVDIIIIGGGIIGLTAALAMAQKGFTVGIIDRTKIDVSTKSSDTRVYAINIASQNLLQQVGVWQLLAKDRISPYKKMHVWDVINHACIDFDSRMILRNCLGYIIEESILKAALLERIFTNKSVNLFVNINIIDITPQQCGIQVTDGFEMWAAKFLMISDGANSISRQLLHIPFHTWPYHQSSLIAEVATEKPHQQIAFQIFHPDGTVAFLPLAQSKACSIVWSTSANKIARLLHCTPEEFNQELSLAFEKKLGQVKLVSQRYNFPLIMRHVKQYHGLNWIILGDAAHTIHPLAGLGLNLGLADIITWLRCLNETNNNLQQRTAASYQRARKFAVWQIIMGMEALKTIFSNPLFPIAIFRGIGLELCNKSLLLKKFFINYASGK